MHGFIPLAGVGLDAHAVAAVGDEVDDKGRGCPPRT